MSRRINIFIYCVALALNASAGMRYVSLDGYEGYDAESREHAVRTIQLGLDYCHAGDTLLIEEGVYHEGFQVKDGVTVMGEGQVILDGTGLHMRLITCTEDCVLPTRVENLILQNARHDERGGAAWLRGTITMKHCVIRGCSGQQCGGVLIKGDLPEASAKGARMINCVVHNCEATGAYWPDAGGVANFDGALQGCVVANCYGKRYGGIHSESSVTECTLWGNRNEYGFVDPANYISDESDSDMSRADEGFEEYFFRKPWLDTNNEAPNGPHFVDPTTFAGVPQTAEEEAMMVVADYRIGPASHHIAAMPRGKKRVDPYKDYTLYQKTDYSVPSFVAHLTDETVVLEPKEQPYCAVATINGNPKTRMAFAWFTNEGVKEGQVQIVAKKEANESDFTGGNVFTVDATSTTTEPLHYAISSSGVLNAARMDKRTAFRYESHKVVAEGLKPGTEYSWRVGYNGHWSEIGHFRTADQKEEEFSFVYMTDSHIQNKEYVDAARMCASAVARNEKNARFCVFPGDFVDTGTENNSEWEWEQWFEEVMKPVLMQMPLVPTDGNHDDSPLMNYSYHFNTDTSFNAETKIRPQFAGINYSFVYGPMQMIVFSMQDFWRGEYDLASRRSAYLEQDLGPWMKRQAVAHPEAKWRVGLVHKNLFSGSGHQHDKESPLLRETMLPVMKECKMDLVMQGHDHCYEVIGPVDSTLYFIGATCGAKRYEPFTREEMEASKAIHQVENYYDLFQHLAQPGAPSYTRVTVYKKELVLETFKVLEGGKPELFNRFSISRNNGMTKQR